MPNVVESYEIGNTKIKFCDDFCRNTSQKSVEEILHRIMGIYISHYNRAEQSKNSDQANT